MKVVLDTNVFVSAFHFPGGPPEAVYRLAIEGRIESIISRALLLELGRVLSDKFGWDGARTEQAVAQVVRSSTVVTIHEPVHEIAADPSDDRVLEAAVAGEAETIVSGDRHLLRLRSWRGITIVPPAVFLKQFD